MTWRDLQEFVRLVVVPGPPVGMEIIDWPEDGVGLYNLIIFCTAEPAEKRIISSCANKGTNGERRRHVQKDGTSEVWSCYLHLFTYVQRTGDSSMQRSPSQLSFELGEGLRLRHTRLKFIPLFDGTREEREPVIVVLTRDGLQLKSMICAAFAFVFFV